MSNSREPYVGMPICIDDEIELPAVDEIENCRNESCFENWALAMAYVPWQPWEKTYSDEKSLSVGTVFPSLNLPFKGGMRRG